MEGGTGLSERRWHWAWLGSCAGQGCHGSGHVEPLGGGLGSPAGVSCGQDHCGVCMFLVLGQTGACTWVSVHASPMAPGGQLHTAPQYRGQDLQLDKSHVDLQQPLPHSVPGLLLPAAALPVAAGLLAGLWPLWPGSSYEGACLTGQESLGWTPVPCPICFCVGHCSNQQDVLLPLPCWPLSCLTLSKDKAPVPGH